MIYSQITNKRVGSNKRVGYKYTERNGYIVIKHIYNGRGFFLEKNKWACPFIREIRVLMDKLKQTYFTKFMVQT